VNVRWSPGPSGVESLADQLTTVPSTENATPNGSGGVGVTPVLRTSAENTTGWPAPVGSGDQLTSTTTRFGAALSTETSALGEGVVGSAVVGSGVVADGAAAELDAVRLGAGGRVVVAPAVGLGVADVVVGAGASVPAAGGGGLVVGLGSAARGAGAFSGSPGWPDASRTPTGASGPDFVTSSGMTTGIVARRTITSPSNTCVRDGRCRLTGSSE
jgi:hypothetical protein